MPYLWTKNLQHVSKEYEIIVLKYLEFHLRASISTCFWALEPIRGRPGDHAGMATKRITKTTLSGYLLLELVTFVDTFVVTFLT